MKKFYRRILSIILTCLLIFSFSSCNKNEEIAITTPIEKIPASIDPQIVYGEDMESVINNCFEGLVRIDSNGNIQKGVAESWTISDDGLTYTFNLRNNAVWYVPKKAAEVLGEDYEKTFDNRVTANDFVFAILRGKNKNTNAPSAATLSVVRDIYAESDTKLVIELRAKSESFLTVLSTPICMPCNEKFFEATAGRYGLSTGLILSNGPYYIASFDDEGTSIVLKDNESYKGEYGAIADKVEFVLDNGDSVGQYDVEKLLLDEIAGLDETYTTVKYKNAIKAFCFNAKTKELKEDAQRIAFAQATNKENFLGGDASAAEGVVPSCCWLYAGSSYRANSNLVDFVKFSIDDSRETFKDGKHDFSISVVCLKSDEENVKKVVQDWQKAFGVSLSVTVKTVDKQKELDEIVSSGNYEIAYTTLVSNNFLAIDFLKEFKTKAEKNILNLSSEEYDALLTAAYNTSSSAEYVQSLKACENYLVQKGYIIPIVVADTYMATTAVASGVSVQPSGTVLAFYN